MRDGQILEIENMGDRLNSSMEQWQKGGLIIFPILGIALNSVDVSKIMNEDQYENYVDTVKPRMFIKNGGWYSIKNPREVIRYEKWRELEIEAERKLYLEEDTTEIPVEEKQKMFDKYIRPALEKLDDDTKA